MKCNHKKECVRAHTASCHSCTHNILKDYYSPRDNWYWQPYQHHPHYYWWNTSNGTNTIWNTTTSGNNTTWTSMVGAVTDFYQAVSNKLTEQKKDVGSVDSISAANT